MIFGESIAAFHIKSIPEGYALLNEATKVAGIKVIEGLALSDGFFFLLNGHEKEITQAHGLVTKSNPSAVTKSIIIKSIHPEVLPGLYSQNKFLAQDAVAICSSPSPVDALSATQTLLEKGPFHLIDLRLFNGTPHFFITGEASLLEKSWKEALPTLKKTPGSHFELVLNPTTEFLQFFNLSGS